MNRERAQLRFSQRSKLPMVLQDELAECGHACIVMISNFWGHELDLYGLRTIYPPTMRGITMRDITHVFEKLNFKTRAVRVSLNDLRLVKKPAILHWNMNHFVVLKKVKKNQLIIHDPAVGIRKCSIEEVSQSFTGIVLEIERSSDFEVLKSYKKLRLYDLVKAAPGLKKFVMILLSLSLTIELLNLLNPLYIQYVIDNVMNASHLTQLYTVAIGFVLIILLHSFVEYIRGNLVIYITMCLTESCTSNLIQHLLKLPLAFFEARHKGDLQSKFQSMNEIQKKISTDFVTAFLDGFMIILNLFVMFLYSPLLTMCVLIALSIYLVVRYASYLILKKQLAVSIHQHATVNSIFLETLQGIMSIKAFLKENVRIGTWRNAYIRALNADIRVTKIQNICHVAQQLVFQLEHIAVICMGAGLAIKQQFSVGMLLAFLSFRMSLVNKSVLFIQQLFDYRLISIQLHRLSDILFQQPEVVNSYESTVHEVNGALCFKNLAFKYHPTSNAIFAGFNLTVTAGEKIAIVGPSGCGKTTLLKVMMGLLTPMEGEVWVGNRTLRDFGLRNYRNFTASVMQEDMLFCGSIMDNIVFFDETIDLEHVYAVAKMAYIHETIQQFPMGYNTLIGDMGTSISGGQRQRILLARALYKKPKFLFLDEATSHLDCENEKQIGQALKALNITQIIVAHRKETILMADRVIDLGVALK